MNKLITIPLVIIILAALIGNLYLLGDNTWGGSWNAPDANGTIDINGTSSNVAIPGVASQSIIITLIEAGLVILITAIVMGIISGISFLGSGLGPNAQELIFNSIIFLGIWGVFSTLAFSLINSMTLGNFPFGWLIWFVLTLMFCIGFAQHNAGESDA